MYFGRLAGRPKGLVKFARLQAPVQGLLPGLLGAARQRGGAHPRRLRQDRHQRLRGRANMAKEEKKPPEEKRSTVDIVIIGT